MMWYLSLSFAVSVVATWCLNMVALVPWRRAVASGAHWTERARVLYKARIARLLGMVTVPFVVFFLTRFHLPDAPYNKIGFAAFAGAYFAGFFFDRTIEPRWSFRTWMNFQLLWILPKFGMLAAAAVGMHMMFGMSAQPVWIVTGYVVVALIMVSGPLFWIFKGIGLLRPGPDRLDAIVNRAAERTGTKVSGSWVIDIPLDFAAALVTLGSLLFSTRMLEEHSDEELEAICLHEIAHLSESRLMLFVRVVFPVLFLMPFLFLAPAMRAFQLFGLVLVLLGPVLLQRLFLMFSVRMEKRADSVAVAGGHAHADAASESGAIYARALDGVYRNNQMPVVMSKSSSTHPNHYDRMLAAGVTPDYQRPKAAAKYGLVGWLQVITLAVTLAALIYNKG